MKKLVIFFSLLLLVISTEIGVSRANSNIAEKESLSLQETKKVEVTEVKPQESMEQEKAIVSDLPYYSVEFAGAVLEDELEGDES